MWRLWNVWFFSIALIVSLTITIAWATTPSPSTFILDLPPNQSQPPPDWLTVTPQSSAMPFATQSFQLRPPADAGDLAITFYFTEIDGGFLRVIWHGATHSEMLCDNLYEGIGTFNQRTLVIRKDLLTESGELELQSSSSVLGVTKMMWSWTSPTIVLKTSDANVPALLLGPDQQLPEQDINGLPPQTPADSTLRQIVTAYLIDKPERIDHGLEIITTLNGTPNWGRIEARFLGLGLTQPLQLWINDQQVGDFAFYVPDLADPGYTGSTEESPRYSGWRKGVIYLPQRFFHSGENHFVFYPLTSMTGVHPLAAKEIKLQIAYGETSGAASVLSTTGPSISPSTAIEASSSTGQSLQ